MSIGHLSTAWTLPFGTNPTSESVGSMRRSQAKLKGSRNASTKMRKRPVEKLPSLQSAQGFVSTTNDEMMNALTTIIVCLPCPKTDGKADAATSDKCSFCKCS